MRNQRHCEKCKSKLGKEEGNLAYFTINRNRPNIICDACHEELREEEMNTWIDEQEQIAANFDDYYNDSEYLKERV